MVVITGAVVDTQVHVFALEVTAPVLSAPVQTTEVKTGSSASAAARTDGTNAEPKSPASKPAVATAVANFFLMNYCESQSAICHIDDTNLGLLCT